MPDLENLAAAVDWSDRETADNIGLGWDDGYREMVDDYIAAKEEYSAALRQPWLEEMAKLERAKFVGSSIRRLDQLFDRLEKAQQHLATFTCIERWLYTERELLEAEAAEEAAQGRHDFYYTHYWHAFGDLQAGMKAKRLPSRVVDGVTYLRTGIKKVDGERRETWEQVI